MVLTYNASGDRLSKTVGGNETFYLYSGGKVSSEISPHDTKTYLYGMYGLRGMLNNDGFSDVYTDHLGSPRVVGQGGSTVSAAHYAPFGKPMPITGNMPAGFNGYKMDEETGLYYSTHRFYDPETARFLSLDPEAAAESPYAFCSNDPINMADPNGDKWWSVLLGVVAGVIGAAATVATAGLAAPQAFAAEAAMLSAFSAEGVAIGIAAGAVGSVAGELVTAACDQVPITGKLVANSLILGCLAGGLTMVAGPTASKCAHFASEVAGRIAVGGAINCTIGAGIGMGATVVSSAITDTPLSGKSITFGALIGLGSGLVASCAFIKWANSPYAEGMDRFRGRGITMGTDQTMSKLPTDIETVFMCKNSFNSKFPDNHTVLGDFHTISYADSWAISGWFGTDKSHYRTSVINLSRSENYTAFESANRMVMGGAYDEWLNRSIFSHLGIRAESDFIIYNTAIGPQWTLSSKIRTIFHYVDVDRMISHARVKFNENFDTVSTGVQLAQIWERVKQSRR